MIPDVSSQMGQVLGSIPSSALLDIVFDVSRFDISFCFAFELFDIRVGKDDAPPQSAALGDTR